MNVLNVERALCSPGTVPLEYESTEVFRAWARHGSGEIFAAAARLGTSNVYGLRRASDSFALFDVRRPDFPDLDVCTIAVGLGSRTALVDKAGATDAMVYFVKQLNEICALEPPLIGARVRKAHVRVVAGRLWTLDLQVGGQQLDGVEVWQDHEESLQLTKNGRAMAEFACEGIRRTRDGNDGPAAATVPTPSSGGVQGVKTPAHAPPLNDPPGNLTRAQMKKMGGGLFMELPSVGKYGELAIADEWSPPSSYDLRQKFPNCVNPSRVRFQGQCGSCWSFATHTAWANQICARDAGLDPSVDSSWTLSTQYQLTCNEEQAGCQGGTLSEAWKWTMHEGGMSEMSLPYAQVQNTDNIDSSTNCRAAARSLVTEKTKCRSRKRLRTDRQIMHAIKEFNTPVTVGMMTYSSFYEKGWWGKVYQPTKDEATGPGAGGHAVQIIGWGTDSGVSSAGRDQPDYWIVENSWGNSWVRSTPSIYSAKLSRRTYLRRERTPPTKLAADLGIVGTSDTSGVTLSTTRMTVRGRSASPQTRIAWRRRHLPALEKRDQCTRTPSWWTATLQRPASGSARSVSIAILFVTLAC